MTIESRTTETPRFSSLDYTADAEACEARQRGGRSWYLGRGIDPASHPLARSIPFDGCGDCGRNDVLVIAAQWCVHPASGDAYWDYEIVCRSCGRYTQRSFSEND